MTRSTDRHGSASIRARLLNRARKHKEEFQRVLVRYGNERFLYRLYRSEHVQRFVLKGATLFAIWADAPHRSTKDIDLLGFGSPDIDRLASILRTIATQEVERDGIRFDIDSLKVRAIREGHEYDGIRATFTAFLGSARIPLQIDIAFGDATAISPVEAELPTLLTDQPAPRLRVYSRELVVAEKFHAIVDRGMLNTRMKDYYDMFILSRRYPFDGPALTAAISSTFSRRRTDVPVGIPEGLVDAFADDPTKASQWRAFLRRTDASEKPELRIVVTALRDFLVPPCNSPVAEHWPPGGPWRSRTNGV